MDLDNRQTEAVQVCCDITQRVVAVTGAAGTGKTTIMRQAFTALVAAGYNVSLAAPTGKAAKRIKEATGIEAKTVHRLLEYSHPGDRDPKTGKARGISAPSRRPGHPLEEDVMFVDEYAMINHELHRNLLDALKPGACIRAFGDINQLPPIEKSVTLQNTPTPFATILQKHTGIKLEHIYRHGEGSGILENGGQILRGSLPIRRPDFQIMITDKPLDKLDDVLDTYAKEDIDFSTTANQIITCTNKSWVGTKKLNPILQQRFHPNLVQALTLPRHAWDRDVPFVAGIGDKVIYTQNDYTLELFNGETGIVVDTTEFGEVIVDLGDRHVTIPPIIQYIDNNDQVRVYDPRRELYPAYTITTHKAQGSEYEHVIYILNKSGRFAQGRANFYTGITRARKSVTVITDQESMITSVRLAMKRRS